jgi:disulfide bond formation protein DsbB
VGVAARAENRRGNAPDCATVPAMSFDTMKVFFALLAVAANLAVVGYLVALATDRSGTGVRATIADAITGYEIPFAWIAATTATLGSLYLSEVVNLPPCTYCWYQRIAMYPLVVILGIAWWRKDPSAARFTVPLAAIGLLISSYHYLIQQFPSLGGGACTLGVPCNSMLVREFGFISIPYMAGSAFALILVLMHMWVTSSRRNPASLSTTAAEPV